MVKIRSIFIILCLLSILSCSKNSKDEISKTFFLSICNYSNKNISLELNDTKSNIIHIDKQTAKIYQFPKSKFEKLEEHGIDIKLYINDKLIDYKNLRVGYEITSYSAYGGYQVGINIISNEVKRTEEIEISKTFCDYDYGYIRFTE